MAKARFERQKEHVAIAVIGHVDAGKTTFTAAMTGVPFSNIDKAPEEKARGITINISNVEGETEKRHIAFIDCPGHSDYVKNMITGANQGDYAILVVDGSVGVQPQTREHLTLVKQTASIIKLFVFINKADTAEPEIITMATEEVIELIEKMHFPFKFDTQDIVVGSALAALEGKPAGRASLEELKKRIDAAPSPVRLTDKPPVMPIEDVYSIEGRGTVVTGRMETGVLKKGTEVEILTKKKMIKTTVTSVEMYRKETDEAMAGESVGLLLRGIPKEDVERGDILSLPGLLKPYKKFAAAVYVLTKEEGGRTTPFGEKYRPQFFIRTADITGNIIKIKDKEYVNPGDNVELEVELVRPTALEKGLKFSIRESNKTIGSGVVTEVLG